MEETCSTTHNCVYFARDVQNSNWLWSQYPCNTAWNFICEQQSSVSNSCDDEITATSDHSRMTTEASSFPYTSSTVVTSSSDTSSTALASSPLSQSTTTTGSSSTLNLNHFTAIIGTAVGLMTFHF
jgi:hypothetical protein